MARLRNVVRTQPEQLGPKPPRLTVIVELEQIGASWVAVSTWVGQRSPTRRRR